MAHSQTDSKDSIMKVYQSINAVQSALSKVGIAKDKVNSQGSGYKFRGVDDVMNALSPLLAEHNLCILPRVISRVCEERISASNKPLFFVTVEVEFDFVSSEDGSKHTVKTFGEAMDSGDKATNKAMSAAYKYAAFQSFSIPTEADADASTQTLDTKEPPTISDKRLDSAILQIKAGNYTTDKLRESFSLTKDQDQRLIKELSNA
jgi:hypothetical protein